MALNSVDDQYVGCRGNMANLVETKYLKEEMSTFEVFWNRGKEKVKEAKDGLRINNLIAIHVYTDYGVYEDLENAVSNGKDKFKDKTFTWYSLHFLLTEAIQILRKAQNKCYDTYQGTDYTYVNAKDVLNKEVRFGSFASSSLDQKVTKFLGRNLVLRFTLAKVLILLHIPSFLVRKKC